MSCAAYIKVCGWLGGVYALHGGVSLSLLGCLQAPANEEGRVVALLLCGWCKPGSSYLACAFPGSPFSPCCLPAVYFSLLLQQYCIQAFRQMTSICYKFFSMTYSKAFCSLLYEGQKFSIRSTFSYGNSDSCCLSGKIFVLLYYTSTLQPWAVGLVGILMPSIHCGCNCLTSVWWSFPVSSDL